MQIKRQKTTPLVLKEYLHLRVPAHLKERVRRVAAEVEFKKIGQVVTEQFVAYLARNEPAHMRQAWEAEEAARTKVWEQAEEAARKAGQAARANGNGNGTPAGNGQNGAQ